MDFVIERKDVSDLAGSIMDGRCGAGRVGAPWWGAEVRWMGVWR
jgi:hypothetical protein